jgi:uncharacterized membrane protein (Fun14 family)
MRLSEAIGIVWVFLVSIWARGWAVSFHIPTLVFWVGIAFVVVRLLEWIGVITWALKNPRGRRPAPTE